MLGAALAETDGEGAALGATALDAIAVATSFGVLVGSIAIAPPVGFAEAEAFAGVDSAASIWNSATPLGPPRVRRSNRNSAPGRSERKTMSQSVLRCTGAA